MPKSVSAAGTPFKQILTGGQRTTESPRSNNSHLHRFAQSATERNRSNNSHIHRFAQSATEIREGGGRASAGRASRSNSATASMRSSSASSNTRSLDRLKRQKGDAIAQYYWSRAMVDWLFYPAPDIVAVYAPVEEEKDKVEETEETEEKGKAESSEDDS
ncbi:MAG: hypothetical protein P8104_09750 [Gammaproteobacteria bacterium]